MDFLINEKGFWENEDDRGHATDEHLSRAIVDFFKNKDLKILDIGCGQGLYTKALKENEVDCDGYDGNPNTEAITNGLCSVFDFTKKFITDKKYDWVICLEVGEHVPKEYEDIIIENISNNATEGIILSWAIPGQPGDGHVNCQTNEYVKNKFNELGFVSDSELETHLRSVVQRGYWFKNTILVFRK